MAVPVDGRGLEAEEVDDLYGGAPVGEQSVRVAVEPTGDDEVVLVVVVVDEEFVDLIFGDLVIGVVALGLDRRQPAAVQLGDEVDADIAAPAFRPFAPAPDLREPLTVDGIGL